ncbi:hypothetical protein Hanom_Chr13g01243001 [Helianthus anomalus]
MGMGLGRGLGTNTQVTTPGGLGFWRGPIGGGFSPGVGWGYEPDMARCHWPTKLTVWASCWTIIKKKNLFPYINILPYLAFFSHNIKHIKHKLAISSPSSSESSSSSEDGAKIFLQTSDQFRLDVLTFHTQYNT